MQDLKSKLEKAEAAAANSQAQFITIQKIADKQHKKLEQMAALCARNEELQKQLAVATQGGGRSSGSDSGSNSSADTTDTERDQ
jgi:hypothetical protein